MLKAETMKTQESQKECCQLQVKQVRDKYEEELQYKENVANDEVQLLNEQITELYQRNEDLIDLIKQLDEKMSMLEQFIIKNVDNGEDKLMEIINMSPQLTVRNNPISMTEFSSQAGS